MTVANIYQRIRAQQAKRDAAEERKRQNDNVANFRNRERADIKREQRIEALCRGDVMPRNAEEMRLVDRAVYGFDDE